MIKLVDGDAFKNMIVEESGGKKSDKDKRRYTLLFDAPDALEMTTQVLEYGEAKYDRCNWKDVDIQRYRDALLRHFGEEYKGNIWDDKEPSPTYCLHWANIMCCALFSLQKEIDRLKKEHPEDLMKFKELWKKQVDKYKELKNEIEHN